MMQIPKNTREWLIHITDQINMFSNWKEQEKLVNHLIENDVVPVIRCKDCKNYNHGTCNAYLQISLRVEPDHYCGYGKKE